MNAKFLLPLTLLASAAITHAEDSPPGSAVATAANPPTAASTITSHWDRALVEKSEPPGVRLGKKDWWIKGPVVEGIRRQRPTAERSAGQRLRELPVVRLVVPQPMETPPGGGKYFRWGESDRPWTAIAAGAAPGRSSSDPLTHEARTSLVSIVR
jgi:hypothetical protein